MKQVIQSQATQPPPDPNQAENSGGHMLDEADIGSGGKTPAEHDADKETGRIPPKPGGAAAPDR